MSSSLQVRDLCTNSSIKFGTSGVRGLIKDLNPTIIQAFIHAFLTEICPNAKTLALGIDLRPSSTNIAQHVATVAEKLGLKVINCGELPTPALAYFALQNSMPAIMVTGSHIPFDQNGLKFYSAHGEITKQDELRILYSQAVVTTYKQKCSHLPIASHQAIENFLQRYYASFPKIFLKGKRIGVYEHSSVARDILKTILENFGAEVVSLERCNHFVALDTEAISKEDQEKAYDWSRDFKLNAIISADGDGDRPLLADENGLWIRGDIIGLLTCKYLGAHNIAAPLTCNTSLETSFPEANIKRTRVGSPYVLEALEGFIDTGVTVGFEANGGVILASPSLNLSPLPTRDAVLPILSIMALAGQHPISEIAKQLPSRHTASDRLANIPNKDSQRIIERLETANEQNQMLAELWPQHTIYTILVDTTDGIRLTLSNHTILHLRASGNARELRGYVEDNSSTSAQKLCSKLLRYAQCLLAD